MPKRPSSLPVMLVTTCFASMLFSSLAFAQTPPPTLGQETKGLPADLEEATNSQTPLSETEGERLEQEASLQTESDNEQKPNNIDSLLGTATVTESKRQNGQRYRIELEHSLGGKQYLEENDSDGKLEPSGNEENEKNTNIPKWRLGSW